MSEPQPYNFPQSKGYETRDIRSAYFVGGSLFPSYFQMQSLTRYVRPVRDSNSHVYTSSLRSANYRV